MNIWGSKIFVRVATQGCLVPKLLLLTGVFVSTRSVTDASHAHLFNLPTTGVLSEFVYEPSAINSLQDLPLIVIPKSRGGLVIPDANYAIALLVWCTDFNTFENLEMQSHLKLYTADGIAWFINCYMNSPHCTTEFLVRHAGVLFLLSPHLSHSLRFEELKNTLAPVLPLHQALVHFWVDQNVPDELP